MARGSVGGGIGPATWALAAAVGLAALAGPRAASGAIVVSESRADFAADVAAAGLDLEVQGYDGLAAGTVIPNGTAFDGVIYQSSAGDSVATSAFLPLSPPNTLGRTPTEFFAAGDSLLLTFTAPVLAFGISFNTFATAEGAFTLTTDLGDVAPSFLDPFPGFNTGQFAGFVSDTPITSVLIESPGGFSFTLDDLSRAVVPEPSTAAPAAAAGLAGLIGLARRRRRSR